MPLTLEEVKRQAQTKHDWTYADYAQLPTELRCEIYDGNLTMSPSPLRPHQRLVLALAKILDDYVVKNQLGEVQIAPFDVVLSERLVLQPDILVVTHGHLHRITEKGVVGAPDLVVEVMSPSSMRHDRTVKFRYYEEAGVAEYWLVDPGTKSVEIYSLQREGEFAGRYDLLYDGERPDHRWSAVLEGLSLEQPELFRGIPGL